MSEIDLLISTMRPSKPTVKKSDQEKCGVWLDVAELKGKAKRVSICHEYNILSPALWFGASLRCVDIKQQQKMILPSS